MKEREPFQDWLERKYGHLQLTPRHLQIAKAVYEEEILRDQNYYERED